ncbi:MAG TPA: hypothetical protein DD391_07620 [Clostridiales bacterium]|jgi:hypothetical protein|nr:hypothetical protein [Clostridiales bacterium]HBL82445.1 hypothetical protein [Clostridiales bacterium]
MKKLNAIISVLISSILFLFSTSVFAETATTTPEAAVINGIDVLAAEDIDFTNAYPYVLYQNEYGNLETIYDDPIVVSWTSPELGSYVIETLGEVSTTISVYSVNEQGEVTGSPSVARADSNLHAQYNTTCLGGLNKYIVIKKNSDHPSPGTNFLFRIVRTDQSDDATNYLDEARQDAANNNFSNLKNSACLDYIGDVDIFTYNVTSGGTVGFKFKNVETDLTVTVRQEAPNTFIGALKYGSFQIPSNVEKTHTMQLSTGKYYIQINETAPDAINKNDLYGYDFEFIPPGSTSKSTVSGTVSTPAATANIDSLFNDLHSMTVYAKTSVLGDVVTSTVVDSAGNYQFDLAPGSYVLEFERAGYLTRYTQVTVGSSDVTVPDKTLLKGDVNGDGVVNQTDRTLVSEKIAVQYPSAGYDPACDFDGNGSITASDIGDVVLNMNKTIESYGENVVIPGVSGKITPVVSTDDDDFDDLHKITVTMKRASDGAVVAATEADKATGAYSFIARESGNFILEFRRAGFLTRQTAVTFSDSKIVLPDKALLAGDVNGDGVINTTDTSLVTGVFGKRYPDAGYNPACDFDGNTVINTDDATAAIGNFGKSADDYVD